ncbi:MAG: Spy/CpxP family protein refolding chaperone [Pyrinomonadaceae bacterium]
MKKIILSLAAAAILVSGALFVFSQKGPRKDSGHFGKRGKGVAMFLRGLDLTDEQKAKVKEITDASRTSVEPMVQQLRENHKKIAGLGTDGTFDQTQVEAAAAEQGAITARLIVEKEKAKAQIFAILTDEQKAKASEMRAKFEERSKNGKRFRGKRADGDF